MVIGHADILQEHNFLGQHQVSVSATCPVPILGLHFQPEELEGQAGPAHHSRPLWLTKSGDLQSRITPEFLCSWTPVSRMLSGWFLSRGLKPEKIRVKDLLEFLQAGLDKGISMALSSALSLPSLLYWSFQRAGSWHLIPTSASFSVGSELSQFPPITRAPMWYLAFVFRALMRPPFKPMVTCHLGILFQKTAYLQPGEYPN